MRFDKVIAKKEGCNYFFLTVYNVVIEANRAFSLAGFLWPNSVSKRCF